MDNKPDYEKPPNKVSSAYIFWLGYFSYMDCTVYVTAKLAQGFFVAVHLWFIWYRAAGGSVPDSQYGRWLQHKLKSRMGISAAGVPLWQYSSRQQRC